MYVFFALFAFASNISLVTSSVTYCNPPESILVQQLDIIYYNRNQSIFFDISAASVVRIHSFVSNRTYMAHIFLTGV